MTVFVFVEPSSLYIYILKILSKNQESSFFHTLLYNLISSHLIKVFFAKKDPTFFFFLDTCLYFYASGRPKNGIFVAVLTSSNHCHNHSLFFNREYRKIIDRYSFVIFFSACRRCSLLYVKGAVSFHLSWHWWVELPFGICPSILHFTITR